MLAALASSFLSLSTQPTTTKIILREMGGAADGYLLPEWPTSHKYKNVTDAKMLLQIGTQGDWRAGIAAPDKATVWPQRMLSVYCGAQ